jgi:hypothetical protein
LRCAFNPASWNSRRRAALTNTPRQPAGAPATSDSFFCLPPDNTNCYAHLTPGDTYDNQRAACRRLYGGHMAVFETVQEQRTVEEIFRRYATMPKSWWLGVRRPGAAPTSTSPWYTETDPNMASPVDYAYPRDTTPYWHAGWYFYSNMLGNTGANCLTTDTSQHYGENAGMLECLGGVQLVCGCPV